MAATEPAVPVLGSLFILDSEGVFYYPPRQELQLFNTAATFIWCCVEEGMSTEAIIPAYSEAFDTHYDQARAHVCDTLHRWWGLGYIERPSLPPVTTVSFATALSWLLGNPALRARYEDSAADVTRALCLNESDAASFGKLNPGELKALAQRVVTVREPRDALPTASGFVFGAMADDTMSLTRYAAQCRLAGRPASGVTHHYGLLDTTFTVRYASRAQADHVHAALAHLAIPQVTLADVEFDVLAGPRGHVIMQGPLPLRLAVELTNLAPLMKDLLRQTALNRKAFFVEIHAAVLCDGRHCILLPGDPGSGKTTLTAGMVHAGYEYFSDEVAVLCEDTMDLAPAPLALGIKPGAAEVLGEMFPAVKALSVHDREDGQQVRYMTLQPEQIVSPDTRRAAKWLVFPRYDAQGETALRSISRADALQRLLAQCLVMPKGLDENKVVALVKWMRKLQCYELPMNSLAPAIKILSRLIPPQA